jgi:hypothetical protein
MLVQTPAAPSAPLVAPPAADPSGTLLRVSLKLCAELHALTGQNGGWVMLDIVAPRLRVHWRQLVAAATMAKLQGWVARRGDDVMLTDKGRRMLRGELPGEQDHPSIAA